MNNTNQKWKFSDLVYEKKSYEETADQIRDDIQALKSAANYESTKKTVFNADEHAASRMNNFLLALIRSMLNVQDPALGQEHIYQEQMLPRLKPLEIEYSQALAQSPFRPQLAEEFGTQLFAQGELDKQCFCEKNIPLIQKEKELEARYRQIMGSCRIPFMGNTVNLAGIRKYFEHEDRTIRKEAWQKYAEFLKAKEPELSELFGNLVALRDEMGRNLGYPNYLFLGHLRQGRIDYGTNELSGFRETVKKEFVPFCESLYEAQKERLGLDELMAWDESLIFPNSNAQPAGDEAYLLSQAQIMYHKMSPETGEFIDFMTEHELMDFENRPGKTAGGFYLPLPVQKAIMVFSSFNGTIADVQVLTHELGHAFALYMAMRSQPLSDYYFEKTGNSEIHSMAMEQFAYPYAELFFGKDADKYRFAHLQEAITFVPFGVAVDEFEHLCYEQPFLSAKDRHALWKHLEEKYMPWRNYGGEEFLEQGGYWIHKMHIFDHPLFYVNYTLTTIAALEFKKRMLDDPDKAWDAYLALCRSGGSKGWADTLACAGIKSPFAPGAVAESLSCVKKILLQSIQESL